jgi:tRNA pseudouridine32 synthase / 23S rRNA pseudouridine746 synthase
MTKSIDIPHFIAFKDLDEYTELPEKFTFPFYYEPHPLAIKAANELQIHLQSQNDWDHNFGLNQDQEGLVIGKMFGVLVVQNSRNQLGYIAAFSGKLAGGNHHALFVPPVYDILTEEGFYRKEELVITEINERIEHLEQDPRIEQFKSKIDQLKSEAELEIAHIKSEIKKGKLQRKNERNSAEQILDKNELEQLLERLRQQSIKEQYFLKDKTTYWKNQISTAQDQYDELISEIELLKEERKNRSNLLQHQIFNNYYFLNAQGKQKSLGEIFQNTVEMKPPAGSGECAAPKLLQYAFLNNLKPIALAEFWWGQSPASEIRKHGNYYPACRGKCEPILGHMLTGIETDPNPMLENPAEGKELPIIYEDDYLMVVNKPAEFLSVPGITIQDSVYDRLRYRYPEATGPLIVHRLDMSTSGLMVIAKQLDIYKKLQRQFINRSVKKRYLAVLEGEIETSEGTIDLPLRVDLEDRPRQLICYEHGKKAITNYEVLERKNGQTRIHFFPVTGRTHQLRVHASHQLGLSAPIVGDDLYGIKGERLHLQANMLEFLHPATKERLRFELAADF